VPIADIRRLKNYSLKANLKQTMDDFEVAAITSNSDVYIANYLNFKKSFDTLVFIFITACPCNF